MNKLIKIITILALLIFITGCEEKPIGKITKDTYNLKSEMNPRLKAYPEAVEWYENSDMDKVSAFNLGVLYHTKIKDYEEAKNWYLIAYKMGYKKAANNLGIVFEYLANYNEAVKWYLKSNSVDSLSNLGLLYIQKLKNYSNAIKYYKLAIQRESIEATKSIATLYNELGDNIKASAYLLTLIEYPNYTKEEVLNYLRNDLKIDNETIKKGYELQLTMPGLPRRYKGGI
ncbi:hypothetical protein CRV00_04945 [Malaciobacter molluscorum]|uniref:tetratricopeptide repeat protein n=1 Tax=Malaciobacter molluscorum TaxID=1032072 RepID=UPI00100A9E4F|nr:tetratricopeptide repeat protein [Malaciobacter molluscorum]RXJ95105.1 hypothetical protein CRV00_04945 [Malaciobacter molluscorum]